MLRLWNTPHRALEVFEPQQPGKVTLYTCGPTVYYFAHIGNLRTYLFEDTLKRALQKLGYEVMHVMNVTDVGHLVGDGDEGEDKVERAAATIGKSAWELARYYEEQFVKDLGSLHVLPAQVMPRATEHIAEQIALVQELEKRGHTYRAHDGIYFDTSTWPAYGQFSGQSLDEKKAGARVEMKDDKRNPTDFALWKFSPTTAKRQMEWESPWGIGFPGWHIECSAMSVKYLGQPIDIHCGGVDHVPVHHENEVAQTEAATGKPFVRYWLHGEFLLVDGQRMAKSLGNGYTLTDIQTKFQIDPLAFRYFCLGAHYRTKLNFTAEAVQAAQTSLNKLRAWVASVKVVLSVDERAQGTIIPSVRTEFLEALSQDLNTAEGLAIMLRLIQRDAQGNPMSAILGSSLADVYTTLLDLDDVFGFDLATWEAQEVSVPAEIQTLVDERMAARAGKDWAASDRLRDELRVKGWLVEDHAGKPSTVRPISEN
jgi:cysteinyl-tRNA synthetase